MLSRAHLCPICLAQAHNGWKIDLDSSIQISVETARTCVSWHVPGGSRLPLPHSHRPLISHPTFICWSIIRTVKPSKSPTYLFRRTGSASQSPVRGILSVSSTPPRPTSKSPHCHKPLFRQLSSQEDQKKIISAKKIILQFRIIALNTKVSGVGKDRLTKLDSDTIRINI